MVEGITGSEVIEQIFQNLRAERSVERVLYSRGYFDHDALVTDGGHIDHFSVARGMKGYIIRFGDAPWLVGMNCGDIINYVHLYAHPLHSTSKKKSLQDIAEEVSKQSHGTILIRESNRRGKLFIPSIPSYVQQRPPCLSETVIKTLESAIVEHEGVVYDYEQGWNVVTSSITYSPKIVDILTQQMIELFTTKIETPKKSRKLYQRV